jgi:DNA-directed RNA polymerase specialized sigma24 family protein
MTDYDNSAMSKLIEEKIHNDLHRRVLMLRLIDGWTYERIAEAVDRSPRQIGYIIAKEAPRLRDLLS